MDTKEINIVYSDVIPKLKYWVTQNSGVEEDAHDVLQEVLEMILIRQKMGNLDIKSSLTAYVLQACKFRWIDHLRKRKKEGRVISIEETLPISNESVQEGIIAMEEEREKYNLLHLTFAKLTELCRQVLSYFKEGKKAKEIADLVGANSAATVTRRKHACMTAWQNHIKEIRQHGSN